MSLAHTLPAVATPIVAGTFGGGSGSGSASFSQFFSQPGGLGPWIQAMARFVAVAVVVIGLLLVVRDVARGHGAAACRHLVAAVVSAAVLSDLSLLGVATDIAVTGVHLALDTVADL